MPGPAVRGRLRLQRPAADLGGEARPRDHDATAIAFTCLKANNLQRRPDPFGLRFQPGEGTITVYPLDLAEASPAVTAGASLTWRLRMALASGDQTAADLPAHSTAPRRRSRRRCSADAASTSISVKAIAGADPPMNGGRLSWDRRTALSPLSYEGWVLPPRRGGTDTFRIGDVPFVPSSKTASA